MKRLLCLMLVSAPACTAEYSYLPTTNATVVQSHAAAHYALPSGAPRGDLELEPLGVSTMSGTRVLHVRAILMNNDVSAWTFDAREQHLDMAGYVPTIPVYVQSSAGTSSMVTVPTGGKAVVDLYFPLPVAASRERRLPAFDVVWNVHTSQGIDSRRTEFDRVTMLPTRDLYEDTPGIPYYYYGEPVYPFR